MTERTHLRIRFGALLAGVVLDHLVTPIFLTPVTFVWLVFHHGGSIPQDVLDAPAVAQAPLAVLGAVGAISTLFGGYAAARLAGRAEVLHGSLVGVAAVLIAVVTEALLPGALTLSYVGLVSVPVLLAATVGGFLARRAGED